MVNELNKPNGWRGAGQLVMGLVLGIVSGGATGFVLTRVNAARLDGMKEVQIELRRDVRDIQQDLKDHENRLRSKIITEIDRHELRFHAPLPGQKRTE
jgi:hypothetical protein